MDRELGGLAARCLHTLVGAHGSGKTSAGLAFVEAGREAAHRSLVISHLPPEAIRGRAADLGWDWRADIAAGRVQILQYRLDVNQFLPGHAIDEFGDFLEKQSVQRVVFDPVTPWLVHTEIQELRDHVRRFARRLEATGATALCTVPQPSSPHAHLLVEALRRCSHTHLVLADDGAEIHIVPDDPDDDSESEKNIHRPGFLSPHKIKSEKSVLRNWRTKRSRKVAG